MQYFILRPDKKNQKCTKIYVKFLIYLQFLHNEDIFRTLSMFLSGHKMKHYTKYNFELTDYDRPPALDITQITNKLITKDKLTKSFDISMERTVKDYILFLERCYI